MRETVHREGRKREGKIWKDTKSKQKVFGDSLAKDVPEAADGAHGRVVHHSQPTHPLPQCSSARNEYKIWSMVSKKKHVKVYIN